MVSVLRNVPAHPLSQTKHRCNQVESLECRCANMHIAKAWTTLDTGVSAREKARLKRLAKKRPVEGSGDKGSSKRQQVAKGSKAAPADEVWHSNRKQQNPICTHIVGRLVQGIGQARGRCLLHVSLQDAAATAVALAEADQADWEAIAAGQWPFLRLADDLCADLLDPAWGRRHGAAVGLREILRSHAGAACVTAALAVAPSGTAIDECTAVWSFASGMVVYSLRVAASS
jgi:hypothetical protein